MAALSAGVQYGLSSEPGCNGNKDLVFVKLTDSALRSIEEFIRNKGKIGSTPTIQFLPNNEGKISIPNAGAGGSSPVTFKFNLASNADVEGPQGSFECLQQGGASKTLRALGPMAMRMRVLANDDVYEATRTKMTNDAENLKSKCTRVIKPNQTDIGRKVKVKQNRPLPPRPPASHSTHSHPHNHGTNNHISNNNHNAGGPPTNHNPAGPPAPHFNTYNTNYTGYSGSHNGSSGNHNGSGTNHNGSGTNHNASGTNHNASGTNHNGSGTNHNASGTNHNASGTNHNASGTNHNASGTNHHASSMNYNGSSANYNGSSGNHNGSSGNYNGSNGNHNGSNVNHNSSSGNHNGSSGNHNGSSGNHSGSSGNHNGSSGNHNGSSGNHNGNVTGGNTGHTGQPRPVQPPRPSGNPDLLKRPIKERLIQLLALRPYKKPELYARIVSEGIKDKERNVVKTVLQQISCIKDNCYQLHRQCWNDVNEDWPFYSEEEKQILKRRKPQNLTPPLSSDSGHSPSPPPGKRVATLPAQAPPIKKQRISHYKKPNLDVPLREGESSPAALSNGYHSSTSTSGASSGDRKNYSDEDTPPPPPQPLTPTKRDTNFSLNFNTSKAFLDTPPKQNGYKTSPSADHISSVTRMCPSPVSVVSSNKRRSPPMEYAALESTPRGKSPDSTTRPPHPLPTHPPPTTNALDQPDFSSQYTEITSPEQRKRYKAEFAAEYENYRGLHKRVEAVTQVFTRLEERLRGEAPGGGTHRDIKRQIVNEYERTQQDENYLRDRRHFRYLHQKLAHIKRLVHDYDHPPAY